MKNLIIARILNMVSIEPIASLRGNNRFSTIAGILNIFDGITPTTKNTPPYNLLEYDYNNLNNDQLVALFETVTRCYYAQR